MLFCRVFGRLDPSRSPAVDTLRIVHQLPYEIIMPSIAAIVMFSDVCVCLRAVLAAGKPGIATALSLAH